MFFCAACQIKGFVKSIMESQLIRKAIKQLYSFFFMGLFFIVSLTLPQISNARPQLKTVQKELIAQKNKHVAQKIQQQKLEKLVKNAEIKTAEISLKRSHTKNKIQKETLQLKKIKRKTIQLEQEKKNQQKLLEQQLISVYLAGKHDLIKLILNQDDLSKVIRVKSYYLYLNRARLETIENLQSTEKKLRANLSVQKQSLAVLKKLNAKQKQASIALVAQSKARIDALRLLNKNLIYNKSKIQELAKSQFRLKNELKRAQHSKQVRALEESKAFANKKIIIRQKNTLYSSLAKKKGQLQWPIRGKVLVPFGSKRSKRVKWRGISIVANEGEKVRAVAAGRVLFAGYFQGYGMVIALDHGNNYLTLYGYNQTVLQKKGDIVFAGDAIALAGHSGGQDKNSLYFELSYKGKAQNPLKWLKKYKR